MNSPVNKDYIVTIDGPVGSGKSTIGKLLAKRMSLAYLDTGAMYRVVALEALKRKIDPEDENALGKLCEDIDISFTLENDGQKVFSNGFDVTEKIRMPEISMLASRISAVKPVREAMVRLQRNAGKDGGIVVDGRDAGTVVFPNARFKFYLDADMEERAKRRYKELLEKKIKMDYTDLFDDIKKRDMDDCSRELSPLKPADDAVIVDTTWMTIEDVLNRISGEISFYSSSFA